MDIVDSQIHLGPGGITETLAAMDALGIQSALIDEFWVGTEFMPYYAVMDGMVRRPATPTAELAALMHPDRFSYLVRVDRQDPEMRSLIRIAASKPHIRALRIAPGMSQADLNALIEGGFDDLITTALECDIPVIFVAILGQAPAMEGVIRRFPAMRFVVDHCGMPPTIGLRSVMARMSAGAALPAVGDTSTDLAKSAEFEKVLRLAEAYPNVGLKWAHAQGLFEISNYPFLGLRSYLRRALDSFGAERMMWASDVSANLSGESWGELLFWLMDNPIMSPSERARFLGGTAREWLNWPA